ncbi:MAG: hypothetical protein AAB922_00560 [Patescibacteria group bacterium]
MVLLDAALLLLFVSLSVMNRDWMGWEKLGIAPTSDLITTLLFTFTFGYILVNAFLFLIKKRSAIRILRITKILLFCITIFTLVGYPLMSNIMIRRTSVNYLFIHDGALQTEIATRFLLKGKNPYASNFLGTPMESWQYSETDDPKAKNPALYHYVYLPFFLLTSSVGHVIQKIVLGWEDLRFTLFAEYMALLLVAFMLVKNMKEKYLYLTLFAANPLVVHFLVEGRNDTASFLYLLASAFFLSRKNLTASAILLGASMAFKQTLWLAAPFFLGYVFFQKELRKKALRYTGIFLLSAVILIGPFFLWDPKSFIDSTLGYMSGSTLHSYPIKSIGFAQILLLTKVISNSHNYFPFWILQAISVGPLLAYFIVHLKRNPKISSIFLFFGITTLVFLYFSRAFSESYLTIVVLAFIGAFVFYQKEKTADALKR